MKDEQQSEETGDYGAGGKGLGVATTRNLVARWKGHKSNTASNMSPCEAKQEITYVPTSALKGPQTPNETTGANSILGPNAEVTTWDTLVRMCVPCKTSSCFSRRPAGPGAGGHGPGEEVSSEWAGCTTPRSLETPIPLLGSSIHHIRDPYASRIPPALRSPPQRGTTSSGSSKKSPRSGMTPGQTSRSRPRCDDAGKEAADGVDCGGDDKDDEESSSSKDGGGGGGIYTILIRLPSPVSWSTKKGPDAYSGGGDPPSTARTGSSRENLIVSTSDPRPVSKTSIQMMPEDGFDFQMRPVRTSGKKASQAFRPQGSSCGGRTGCGGRKTPATLLTGGPLLNASGEASRGLDEIRRLPLDARLVPKQLLVQGDLPATASGGAKCLLSGMMVPPSQHHPHHHHQQQQQQQQPVQGGVLATLGRRAASRGSAAGSTTSTVAAAPTTATKAKKSSSEKKQERKAAKTLSAILLAFIVTWTPYSVLAVVNAVLGKEQADVYIPEVVWQFSYYLCYINSTVNPMLYALCNAAFRRTYLRIMTCRWTSYHSRQPVNRYYYG